MQKEEPHQRLLVVRRQNGFATATDAARAFGWNENTYRSHENGERGIKRDVAFKYAQAFNTTANFILFGDDRIDEHLKGNSNRIPIVGNVESSDRIIYYPDYFDRHMVQLYAHVKVDATDDFISFSIPPDVSIAGIMPGSLIACLKDKSDIEETSGKFCLVYSPEGGHHSYITRVNPASAEQIVVITPSGEMKHIHPAMILQVIFIVPPGQWQAQRESR